MSGLNHPRGDAGDTSLSGDAGDTSLSGDAGDTSLSGDAGDMAIEAAIVAPVLFFLMFAGLLVAGRSVQAHNQANAAAQEAARAASLQQTPGRAVSAGQQAIIANVGDATGLSCTADVAPGDLAPGSVVEVNVTCLTDIVAGRSATFTATAFEVVDQYRQGEAP